MGAGGNVSTFIEPAWVLVAPGGGATGAEVAGSSNCLGWSTFLFFTFFSNKKIISYFIKIVFKHFFNINIFIYFYQTKVSQLIFKANI